MSSKPPCKVSQIFVEICASVNQSLASASFLQFILDSLAVGTAVAGVASTRDLRTAACTGLVVADSVSGWFLQAAPYRAVAPSSMT